MTGYAIRLDTDDLARVRFGRLHPMWELEDAAHLRVETASSLAKTWLKDSRTRLGRHSSTVIHDLRMGAVQYAAYGVSPTEDVTDLGACLEAALRVPTRRWATQLEAIAVPGWHLPVPGIAAGLARLERSTMRFYESAIAPYWAAARAEADRVVTGWSDVMATQGIGAALAGLHPEITWDPPYLRVDPKSAGSSCPPGCVHIAQERRSLSPHHLVGTRIAARPWSEGLVLLPTVFGETCTIQGMPAAVQVVSVPIAVRPSVFTAERSTARPIEQLLGPSRAWILQACLDHELTTSALARRVGVSVSSASEHAATLRRSGLLESQRVGQTVRHRATDLGRHLANADDAGDDQPARRFLATARTVSADGRPPSPPPAVRRPR